MKLSIAMIVKNEEKNLKRSLEALKSLDGKINYEIIIVDTGSTDKTVDISKKFTNKVYCHSWNNDFAAMRNISLSYCTGEWILVLDADEVLENPECLIEFLNSNQKEKYKSFTVGVKNFTSNDYVFGVLVRLFKNKKGVKYEGIVHEQLVNHKPTGKSLITLLHYGYSRDDYELMKYKYKRNKELLLKQLEGLDGVDRIYPLFQLAKTYSMANKEREAFQVLKESYNLTKKRNDGLVNTYVVHFYAQMLFERRNYEEAIKVSKEGISYSKNNIDYYYIIALSYTELKKFAEAKKYIDMFIEIRNKRDELEYEDNTLTESWYNQLDVILQYKVIGEYEEKNYSEVISTYTKIENEGIKKTLREVYLYCLIKLNMIDDIFKYFAKYKVTDRDIEILINIFKRIESDEDKEILLKLIKDLMKLDNRLEMYIRSIYLNEKLNANYESVDFNKYYSWKSELFNILIDNDTLNVNFLRKVDVENVELYVGKILNDYNSLGKVYEFCRERFLTSNLEELIIITTIEKMLLQNNSIDNERFEELVKRAFINRLNLIRLVYKEDIIKDKNMLKFIGEHDRVILKLEKLIKIYSVDKLEYIRGLKKLLNDSTSYKKIIRIFLDNVNDKTISDEMILEKKNICDIIESYINQNKIEEAAEVVDSLMEIFVYDNKLLNYKGIISYMVGNSKNALLNLSMANIIDSSNYEYVYNIAHILEDINRKSDALYYYRESLKLCVDNNMKENIKDRIESIIGNGHII